MNDEEREAYASQDEVKLNWREILGGVSSSGEGGYGEHVGLADMITSDTFFPEGLLEGPVDPIGIACLKMFHVEGMTRQEIAKAVTVRYVVDGKLIQSKPFTNYMVQEKLRLARRAIKNHFGLNNPNPLFSMGLIN